MLSLSKPKLSEPREWDPGWEMSSNGLQGVTGKITMVFYQEI
jgi:hypothetical protein